MIDGLMRPRVIFVTRKTPLQTLVERHGTKAQARFYLESRGHRIDDYEQNHERFEEAFYRVEASLPTDQRRSRVDRNELNTFLFAPDDVVVVVGQDGLVPNTAKYLDGQITVGINPDPESYDGVLCPHRPESLPAILRWVSSRVSNQFRIQHRVMGLAEREDGQRLLALNEVFVGHRTHQSARYRLRASGKIERQSSSGLICATGTGCTGWARSIVKQRALNLAPPRPEDRRLAWFVREPFPSVSTGTTLDSGTIEPGAVIEIDSEMGEGGVVFADGIETDFVEFVDGQRLRISIAQRALNLVMPPNLAVANQAAPSQIKRRQRPKAMPGGVAFVQAGGEVTASQDLREVTLPLKK